MTMDPRLLAMSAAQRSGSQAVQDALSGNQATRFHQPFQQSSIPGAIIGALLSANPVGQSLMQNINAYRNRDAGIAMQEEAARQFRSIGTPEAEMAADLIIRSPDQANMRAQFMGGWPNWIAQLQSGATSRREMGLIQDWYRSTPAEERSDESLAEFAVLNNITPERAFKMAKMYGALEDKEKGPLTNIAKLQEDLRAAQERGDTKAAEEIQNALTRAQFGSGMEIESTPGGGFRLRTGVTGQPGQGGLEKSTMSDIERKMDAAYTAMGRLRETEMASQPEFLTYQGQAKQWLFDKAARAKIPMSEDTVEAMIAYQDFTSKAMADLVLTLQSLSGAAVTTDEFDRIQAFMPDPEDSYPVFMAQLRAQKRRLARAIARYNAIKNGASFTKESMPLYTIDKIVEDRHLQNVNTLLKKNPNMTPEDAVSASEQMIVKEFGVYYRDLGIKPSKRKD